MSYPVYTRENPSPEYLELMEQYRILHSQGGTREYDGQTREVGAERVFANGEYRKEAKVIKKLILKKQATSLLNFGCGNPEIFYNAPLIIDGREWSSMDDYLGLEFVRMYDPGVESISAYPDWPAEIVLCSDVLEHIPAPDIPWFMDELMRLSTKAIHVTIHTGPAMQILPNGKNAHVCIRPMEWWDKQIANALSRSRKSIHWSIVTRLPMKDGKPLKIDYASYGYVEGTLL